MSRLAHALHKGALTGLDEQLALFVDERLVHTYVYMSMAQAHMCA